MGIFQNLMMLFDPNATMQEGMIQILEIILGLAAAMGVIYSIVLAAMLAMAQDQGKRKQVKDRIVKVLASIVIVLVLYGMVQGYEIWMS